jgi:hypothetical protein
MASWKCYFTGALMHYEKALPVRIRYLFTSGVQITWPFVFVVMSQNAIRILHPWACYDVKKEEIDCLKVHRGWMVNGVQIVHRHSAAPPFLLIQIFFKDRFVRQAKGFGFPVT